MIDEYKKRLSVFCDLKVIEVKSESFDSKTQDIAKTKEYDKLLEAISKIKADNVYFLAENGKELDSLEFSDKIIKDKSSVAFVIGGALGWPDELYNDNSKIKLSLSKMTFPHELARLMLVEQIYRSLMIIKNQNYHY